MGVLDYFFKAKVNILSNPGVNYNATEEVNQQPVEFIFSGPTFEHLDPILREVEQIEKRQFALLEKKHKMYGSKNLAYGASNMTDPENIKRALRGVVIRLQDKLSRMAVLVDHIGTTNVDELDESIQDTLDDISNYGKLANVIASGKWVTSEK